MKKVVFCLLPCLTISVMFAYGKMNFTPNFDVDCISQINNNFLLGSSKELNDTSEKLVVPEGTPVTLELLQSISSKTAHSGDVLDFETKEPVIIGDRIVVPVGAKAYGKVTEVKKRKGMGKGASLNFSIDYLILSDGKVIKLENEIKEDGKNKTGTAIAEAVVLTPLFLFKKGKRVSYSKGKVFKAFVKQDCELAFQGR